jgi:hypothetical protein
MALTAAGLAFWRGCAGYPWLIEETPPPPYVPREIAAVSARLASLEAQNARVLVIPSPRLDIGLITGERGATEIVDAVLIVEYADHQQLELFHAEATEDSLKLLGLAAMLKYELLHDFSAVVLNGESVSPQDLYVHGQAVTEAAHKALQARDEPHRHLTTGPYCSACAARDQCPAYARVRALELV